MPLRMSWPKEKLRSSQVSRIVVGSCMRYISWRTSLEVKGVGAAKDATTTKLRLTTSCNETQKMKGTADGSRE